MGSRDRMAIALQEQGDAKGAATILEELKEDLQEVPVGDRARYLYARGIVDLEAGRINEAVTHFSDAFQQFYPNRAPQFHYGVALVKAGRLDEAIEELQRVTRLLPVSFPAMSLGMLADAWAVPIASVKAHYWLGVAYEQQGRKEDAAREYSTFLDTWKDADFPSPELKDARARMDRLSKPAP